MLSTNPIADRRNFPYDGAITTCKTSDFVMAKKSKKSVEQPSDYEGLDDRDEFTGRLDRVFHVMRFLPADDATLRAYFALFPTRHEALLALVPVVESLEIKKPEPPKLKAMRLGLPKSFIAAAKKLKRPMTQTIVDAAAQFLAAHRNDGGSAVRQSDQVTE